MNGLSLLDHISIIKDPRQQWKIEHKLTDIIFLSISGADGWEEIQDFGEDHLDWLKHYGDFESGIPVHDTIARVMGMISAKQIQKCFAMWMDDCHQATDGGVLRLMAKLCVALMTKKGVKAQSIW
nr:ISAs1 family transposase [Photobacterium frigidiphilum]